MTYEKPEVRDFGSIAEHTYGWDYVSGVGLVYTPDGEVGGAVLDDPPFSGASALT